MSTDYMDTNICVYISKKILENSCVFWVDMKNYNTIKKNVLIVQQRKNISVFTEIIY